MSERATYKNEDRQTDIVQESLHASAYFFALGLQSGEISRVLDVGTGDGLPMKRVINWIG